VPITDWRGVYYDNKSLDGLPTVVRNDRVVDFNLASGQSPATGIPPTSWSARWSRDWTFDEGNYRFRILVDDGARLWVNEILLVDAWQDGAPREFDANLYLAGQVPIRLEYYNHLGSARIRLNWERVTDYPDWRGSYYPVRDLTGLPRFQRNDSTIDFNWGSSSPRSDIPVDNFSARWTRRLNVKQAGTYRFRVEADDGARLWIDGSLVVDAWRDGYSTDEVVVELAGGPHEVRLDYYEHLGGALARLSWSLVAPTATPTPPPTLTATPTLPPTSTATPTPPPTATAQPREPSISLTPQAGPIDEPITVVGEEWPAQRRVDIYVAAPEGPVQERSRLASTTPDETGRFVARVSIPAGQGWEDLGTVRIVARTRDLDNPVEAMYRISPSPETIPYSEIPTDAARFALQQPTYLALDSARAWAANFGEAPPPVDPAVNWDQELVLGAFLGPQPDGVEAEIDSIRIQPDRVVVQLSSPVSPGTSPDYANLPRTLVRVPRDALGISDMPLTFAFVDSLGRPLAEGPAGAQPLPSILSERSQEIVPPEAEPGLQAVPGDEVAPEAEAPAEAEEPGIGAAEAPADMEAPAAAAAQAQPESGSWFRTANAWLLLLVWGVVVVLVVAGAFLLIRRAMEEGQE
jgi:hypothetical protein